MPITELGKSGVSKSPELEYIQGRFDMGSTKVPYFSSCVEVGKLARLLDLPGQLPFNPERPLQLEELFQRELDRERVTREIVPYLKNPQRLRFFNALTVILLPLDPDNSKKLSKSYPQDESLAPAPSRKDLEHVRVGPILLSHLKDDKDVGFLCWNTDLISAVLLDGQHRFWAMKEIMDESSHVLRTDLSNSRIAVLFLVLDKRAGFDAGAKISPSVLDTCRSIFIDLNKHAEEVSPIRQYLLDDLDLPSVTMRGLIAEGVDKESTELSVSQRIQDTGRLPLAVVDWQGNSAKFDSGVYLTTIPVLYDMVKDTLAIPSFDYDNYEKAREAFDKLDSRLSLSEKKYIDRRKVRELIKSYERDFIPYQFGRDIVMSAAEAFREKMGWSILTPLVRLSPYEDLINQYERQDFLGSKTEPWFSLSESGKNSWLAESGIDISLGDEIKKTAKEVKGRYPLAFQVVFQKAIVLAFRKMYNVVSVVAEHWGFDGKNEDKEKFATEWLLRANKFVVPSLAKTGSDSPFFGAGIRVGGKIDHRKTRIESIAGFIINVLLAPVENWSEASPSKARENITTWTREKFDLIQAGRKPAIDGLFSQGCSNWKKSIEEIFEDLASSGTVERDNRDEYIVGHAVNQMVRLVDCIASGNT